MRLSREPQPEPGGHDGVGAPVSCGGVVAHETGRVRTFERELQDGLVGLSRRFVERSPTPAVRPGKLLPASEEEILQELLVTWRVTSPFLDFI